MTLAAVQAENAALRQELAQTQAALADFTSSVSHDLRASLRHITAYADILREDLGSALDPAIGASLTVITNAARHLAQLIDGLMALARIGQVALQPSTVALANLLDEVRAKLAQDMAAELATRSVQWHIASPLPPVVVDVDLLRLVLQQVLANALKFTRGREVAQIEISCTMDGGCCQLQIHDNGVGYNPQYQAKLFHALSRLHSTAAFEGIGMGLALCRAAAKRLGGEVSAQGQVDGGCTITLSLPCAR